MTERPPRSVTPSHTRQLALLAITYLVAHRVGAYFLDPATRIAPVWLAGGVALASLLLLPRQKWGAMIASIAILTLASNIYTSGRVVGSVLFLLPVLAELALAVVIMRHIAGDGTDFTRVRQIAALIAASAGAAALSALIGALLASMRAQTPYWPNFLTWWISDGLGLLLVTPLVVVVALEHAADRRRSARQYIEIALLILLSTLAGNAAFRGDTAFGIIEVHPYMLASLVVWAALRTGMLGVTATLAALATIALSVAMQAEGPFAFGGSDVSGRPLLVQLFLAVTGVTGLLLATATDERQQAVESSRDDQKRLRALGDNLPNAIVYQVLREHDGTMRFVYVSAAVERLHGVTADSVLHDPTLLYDLVLEDDASRMVEAERVSFEQMTDVNIVVRMRRTDGELRWFRLSSSPRRVTDGRVLWDGVQVDVTDRVISEAHVRRVNRALRTISACNHVLVRAQSETDLLREICRVIVDEGGYQLAGVGFAVQDDGVIVGPVAYAGPHDGFLERPPVRVREPEQTAPADASGVRATPATGRLTDPALSPWSDVAHARGFHSSLVLPLTLDADVIGALSVYASDADAFDADELDLLTELADDLSYGLNALRTRVAHDWAKRSLLASEQRFRLAMHFSPIGKALMSPEGRILEVNPSLCAILGHSRDTMLGCDFYGFTHPDDAGTERNSIRQLLEGARESVQTELRFVHRDGHVVWSQLNVSLVLNPDGTAHHFIAAIQDITQRVAAMQELEQQRRRSAAIIESAMDGIITVDAQARIVVFNPAAEAIFGCPVAEALGEPLDRFIPAQRIMDTGGSGQDGTDAPSAGAFGSRSGRRASGKEFPIEASIFRVEVDGQLLSTVTVRDVTSRHEAELALRDSEERFRQLAENIREVFWMREVDTDRLLYVSPGFERFWGISCDVLLASPGLWLDAIHPDDRRRVEQAIAAARGGAEYDEEYRIHRPDGTMRWVHDRAFPIRNAEGDVYRIVGTADDVTTRKLYEEQFRQAQKMDAIGQLAGGVAHDFNNILAAVLMQAGMARSTPFIPPEVAESLQDIEDSAQRAANLTRQLLLFSRKQVMQARRVDVNDVVTSLTRMLRRVLPENVRLQLGIHPRPLAVEADPGMLDQVLMNLAVNARDAMPDGGRLVIETSEQVLTDDRSGRVPGAVPGRFACLRVRDAGMGIPQEVQRHIFEPFFTTKEQGKGTCLGLATVYGIVQQHRGTIFVTSEVGHGTTFEVLLPLAESDELTETADTTAAPAPHGSETILVVEDDYMLRSTMRRVLERHGYRVLTAGHGVEAMRVWNEQADGGDIQLLLTDMVMPEGISGVDLAAMLTLRKGGLKVIFTSGYNPDVTGRNLQLEEGVNFLQKPATPAQTLAIIRRSLDT
ncbi:MAG: PAS domain S-box protein [Gemmatimonadaceae bacterium]